MNVGQASERAAALEPWRRAGGALALERLGIRLHVGKVCLDAARGCAHQRTAVARVLGRGAVRVGVEAEHHHAPARTGDLSAGRRERGLGGALGSERLGQRLLGEDGRKVRDHVLDHERLQLDVEGVHASVDVGVARRIEQRRAKHQRDVLGAHAVLLLVARQLHEKLHKVVQQVVVGPRKTLHREA